MKKYYPLISVGIAIGMLLLPLAFLAWPANNTAKGDTPSLQSSRLEQLEREFAKLKAEVDRLGSRQVAMASASNSRGVPDAARQTPASPPEPPPAVPPETRVASAPPLPRTGQQLEAAAPTKEESELQLLRERLRQLTAAQSKEAAAPTDPPAAATPLKTSQTPVAATTPPPNSVATQDAATPPAEAAGKPAPVKPATVKPKVATPPAAVASQTPSEPTTPEKTPSASPTKRTKANSKANSKPEPRRKTGKSRRGTSDSPPAVASEPPKEPNELTQALTVLRTGREPEVGEKPRFFEMALMQPRGNYVRQTEELIAVTKEPGWPVVVVRSEIDGDNWWVQQLVTRRGNYIASRTKFGNEVTIRGQRFELVILMLDTAEESVRFKTARRFDKLPASVRRSKPLRFIRN